MKKKQFGKKLSLRKITLANLNPTTMRHSKGGGPRFTLDLVDPICLSDVECTVETYPCPTDGCPVPTELATCPVTCNPCDSVFNC